MSKTGTIRRRSKWLSPLTPNPFSRLLARGKNSKATVHLKGEAGGTNAGLIDLETTGVPRGLALGKTKNAYPLRLRYRAQRRAADDDHSDDDGCPFGDPIRRGSGVGARTLTDHAGPALCRRSRKRRQEIDGVGWCHVPASRRGLSLRWKHG